MKRWFKSLTLLLLAVVIVLPVTGLLAQDGDEYPIGQGVVDTREGIGIYAEPSIHAEVVGNAAPGDVLTIYEESGLWVRVDEGWTLASGLDIGPASVNLQGTADTTRTDLAIRTAPDIQADVLKTVPSGTVLGVLELGELFAKVYDGEIIGYAFLSDLALAEPGPDLAELVQRAATTTARSSVAVRNAPDIQAEVMTTVEADVPAQVLADSEDGLFSYVWLEDGTTGWVFTSNLSIDARAYARGTINAGPTNFRAAPDGEVFNRLPFGAPVLLLGQNEDGSWLKVRYNASLFIDGEEVVGAEGWVGASLVDTEYDIANLPVLDS